MANEEFTNLLLELAPTSFLLHFTTKQNWVKIQEEGLVPQENCQKNLYQKPLPDKVIWLGKEPAEVHLNKDKYPIVIALSINYEKFGLQETIPSAEYIADKQILPEEFLGVFDFTHHQKVSLEEKGFFEWLERMEKKTRAL